MTKFAIVIPAYKAAETVAETLQSIALCQPEIQDALAIYLVNDCSPDNQVEIAQASWHASTPPLVVINVPQNKGQWNAVDLGISTAHQAGAEWILCIHADDFVKPDWVREMLKTMNSSPPSVASICCSYDSVETNGNIIEGDHRPNHAIEQFPGTAESVRYTLLVGCWWHFSGAAIQISAYHAIGKFDAHYAALADWEWTLRIFSSGTWGIAYIPKTLTYYRQHANTITAQTIRTTARVEEQLEIGKQYEQYFTRMDSVKWYGKQGYFALRRIGRDLLTRNLHGLRTDFQSLKLIIGNGIRTLFSRPI
jgi:glycosyltransferase involved in cell wall biosynthesis